MANMGTLPFDSAASARKARGAFFTPQSIATFLVEWAIRRPTDTVFEPSCGEAAFVAEAISRLRSLGATTINGEQLQGTDIDSSSVDAARTLIAQRDAACSLTVSDFFNVKPTRKFDAVVGNPPYVRYQAFTGTARTRGLEAALAQGIRLTALASSWAAFVVHAASFVATRWAARARFAGGTLDGQLRRARAPLPHAAICQFASRALRGSRVSWCHGRSGVVACRRAGTY